MFAAVANSTQKDPDERYKSAEEFAADLERFLAGKSVVAPAYRYRLDEREITAARPEHVLNAAYTLQMAPLFVTFLGLTLILCGTSLAEKITWLQGSLSFPVAILCCISIVSIPAVALSFIASTFVPRAMLRGHRWARWCGIMLAGSLWMESLWLAVVAVLVGVGGPSDVLKSLCIVVAIFTCSCVFIPISISLLLLLTRETAAWFRYAEQVRLEHRQMQREMG